MQHDDPFSADRPTRRGGRRSGSDEGSAAAETPWTELIGGDESVGSGGGGSDAGRTAPSEPPARRRRVWPWVTVGAFVLVLAGAAVVGTQFVTQAAQARSDLLDAKAQLTALGQQLSDGDTSKVEATAAEITTKVRDAASITSGTLWNVAAHVPVVGQNVDAVQRVTTAVDTLVREALPPGVTLMTTVDLKKLTVKGGGIDLKPLQAAQKSLPQISAAFASAQKTVAPIDRASLLPAVAEPIDEIQQLISQSAPGIDLVNRYLPTLLDLAGADGTKSYLVIFQNNAEIRATGGNPSASMLVTVTNGKIALSDQSMTQTFMQAGTYNKEFTKLPAQTTKLYLPTLTSHPQDFTFTPDFPTTAALFRNLWKGTTGDTVDGVVSIDPAVLAHMLAVTGPVTLSTGEKVTSQNAVKLLLSDAYERYPRGTDSDKFFTDVAQRVFVHITTTSWDPTKMLAALEQSVKEQRVYLNFTDKKAQALAAELGVTGALATDTKTQTQLGMYLVNSSVSKLDYHLTQTVAAQCDPTARTITETITLHNGIPDSIKSEYTLGWRNAAYGLPRTTEMLDVLFFAPPGAKIVSTTPAKGQVAKWERTGTEKGNTAVSHTVFVPKGKTITVSYTVKLPAGKLGALNLRHTPTAKATKVTIDKSCGALLGQ